MPNNVLIDAPIMTGGTGCTMNPDYNRPWLKAVAQVINGLGFFFFSWIRLKRIDRAKVRRILIVKLDRLGDTFLATPTIEAMGRLFPDAQITALVAPWNQQIVAGNPYVTTIRSCSAVPDVQRDSVLSFLNPAKVRYLAGEIRSQQPDLVVDLQGNPLIVLSALLAGVPIRVGSGRKFLSFLLNVPVCYPNGLHQSEIYFRCACALGYEQERPKPRIFPSGAIEGKIRKIIAGNALDEFIAFHLGAGWPYKKWPVEHFVLLAQKVLEQDPNRKIALIGGQEDEPLARRFLERVNRGVVSFVGAFDIQETYAFLSYARGFVGSDSGPAHLAGALGIPTVMLMNEWSGVDRWKALGEKVHTMTGKKIHRCPGVSCRERPCPNMAAISVEEVLQVVENC